MSNKVVVISDSTCDLGEELLKKYDIHCFPLHVLFDDESYDDGVNINLNELYEKTESTGKLPKTSAASHGEIKNYFKQFIDQGYDIVYTGISSAMSATFQVVNIVKNEFPEGRIYVVDSGNLSTGIGLLLLKAAKMRDQGLSAQEIAAELENIVPRVKSQFVIDTLEYLHKGGRCSGVTYIASKLLSIKPMIVVREKTMQVGAKFIGRISKAQKGMTQMFLNDFDKIDKEFVFITHTMSEDGVKNIKNLISPVADQIENIYETVAGCVIGSHCGKNTIGILYIMKEDIVKKEENIA